MRKTRDVFKNISCKMGTIKDRNGMDLTEADYEEEMARIHRRIVQKISSTQIITMV